MYLHILQILYSHTDVYINNFFHNINKNNINKNMHILSCTYKINILYKIKYCITAINV